MSSKMQAYRAGCDDCAWSHRSADVVDVAGSARVHEQLTGHSAYGPDKDGEWVR